MTRKGGRRTKANGDHSPKKRYAIVAMGGTFDVLHNGHKTLLKEAFAIGRKVMIGVTNDDFAKSLHKPHKVDSYTKRRAYLERLLKRWNVRRRASIVPLGDRYGPTVRLSRIDALVVSKRTVKTTYEINAQRRRRGLKPLDIVPIDLLMADDSRPISSTRIRRGKIDRHGRLVG